jgi:CheY-like chemotaxis protein
MSAGASKRVLVVDDQEEVARVLLLMLVQQGHTVEVARTGSDAVEKVAQFAPDVVYEGTADAFDELLQKPFSFDELK